MSTIDEVLAEMQAAAEKEAARRAAMTPAELAEQLKKDEEDEREIQKMLAQLGGSVTRIQL